MSDTFLKVIDTAMRVRVWNKFKDALGVSNINRQSAFMSHDAAVRHITEKQGNMQLPFMSVWRGLPKYNWQQSRSVLSRRGASTGAVAENAVDEVRAVPVTLAYEAKLWSKDLDALHRCLETYMFWLHQDPNLDLSLNGEYPLEMDMHFGDPVDMSPIDKMYDSGMYFVHVLPITLDAWLFDTTFVKIIKKIFIDGFDVTVDPTGELIFSDVLVGVLENDAVVATDTVDKS